MGERLPQPVWPDPPPEHTPSAGTRVWTLVRTLQRGGWLRPRRIGCLLLVLVALLAAVTWAFSRAVDETVAMFRDEPAPVSGSPFDTVSPQRPAGSGSAVLDRIASREKIIVAVQESPGLAERAPDGGYRGFDIALLELIANDLGVQLEDTTFKPLSGDSRAAAVQRGEVDLVLGGYEMTSDRAGEVGFAGPYLVSPLHLAVPEASRVTGLDTLGDEAVCAPKGSPAAAALAGPLGERLVTRSSLDACRNLLGRSVAAVAADEPSLARHRDLRMVGAPVGSTEYGIGITRGDPVLRERITAVLRRAVADGTWARLYADHLGTPVPDPPAALR